MMWENVRKAKKFIFAVLLTALLPCAALKAAAAERENQTVDFVLVLDCSGSMEESDPYNMSVSAAKMFVQMLPVENVRIAVVGFGPDWGAETYVLDYDADTDTLAKVAFPLEQVSTNDEKDQVKNAISDVIEPREGISYTSIGYSLEVALDVLNKGQAEEDSACIVLMSDGRVTETLSTHEKDTYKEGNLTLYRSIENAIQEAGSKNWPIYCLELNYDNLTADNWLRNTALIQMPRIADGTGGKRIPVSDPTDIDSAFTEIFERFFELKDDSDDEESDPDKDIVELIGGEYTKEFTVDEMTAETNVIISGTETSKVESVELTDPKGVTKVYTESEKTDSRIITFESDQFIMAKLIRPATGDWKVTVKGENGIRIKVMTISIQEMNLRLSTQQAADDVLKKGSAVEFTAAFIYNGDSYSSDKFYTENPAYLEILETGEKFPMTGGNDNYKGTVTFQDTGEFTVAAFVESGYFRNDRKKSQEYHFYVGNLPTEVTGRMEDITMGVNEERTIDCTQYFSNPDSDEVNYWIDTDATSGIQSSCEDGILTLKSGINAGEYTASICANDGEMEENAEQTFKISVVNHPLELSGNKVIKIKVAYNPEQFSDRLLNILGIDRITDSEIMIDEHFKDEDHVLPICEIRDFPADAVIELEDKSKEEGKILVKGLEKGECTFRIVAADASDPSIILEKEVQVKSVDMSSYVWNEIKGKVLGFLLVIFIFIILLTITFAGRKIHGTWEIIVDGQSDSDIRLGRLPSGKKQKCTLNAILLDLDFPMCQSDKIILKGGNNWTKPVKISGLENADEVEYDNRFYDQVQDKISKVVIKRGRFVTLKVDDHRITLKRN